MKLMQKTVWAITPEMLSTMISIAHQTNKSPEAIAKEMGRDMKNTYAVSTRGGVAVIPVTGPLFRHANLLTAVCGATSYELLAQDFNKALNDPKISAILFDVDSPGGEVNGCSELADMIYNARGKKPILAYASGSCCSGAYWIASACDKIMAADTAILGSIGVVSIFEKEDEKKTIEIVSSQSPNKRPDVETEEGKAKIQAHIDALAEVFINKVALHRDISPKNVIENFGGGEGYILCLECGRMVANNKKNREEFKKRHYRLRSGVYPNSQTGNTYKVECQHSPYSIIENINLGVEIKTDLLELILSDLDGNVIDDRTLAYSLAVAIRSGIAKYMNVETEEIGCIAKQIRVNGTNKKGFAIELFDKNASGYCSSNDIIKNLNIIFKYAQNILKCDCAQSCNKCILQNDTKYNYRYLDRKLALEFLTDEWIAKNTLPQDMKIFGDGTLVASASIESLIEDTPNLQKLYLIIPENMENEDFSNSPIYRLVNRYNALNTQIILCVNEKTLGDDVKKTISLLSNLSNVSVKAIPEKLNDKIMAIVWDGFKYYSYASFDENVRQLNQYWGSNINTSILSGYIDINGLKFNDVKLETVENISYDKMFNISSEVNGPGYGFGNRLLSILASSLDKGISSPIVKIEYKDRYLKNPLASGLFYSFIKELKVRYEKLWNCASITLETAETTETNKQYPTMFYHDWDDVDARNEVLTALFDKIGLKFQLKEKNKKYLEHNRIMTIELENGEKINLILDQGFSYWRCLAYCYAENIFPFDADIDEQVAKIGQWLPNVSGDTYPTRIFYTKSK